MNNNTVDFSKLRDFIKNSSDNNKIEKKKRKKNYYYINQYFYYFFFNFWRIWYKKYFRLSRG